jgi:GntR family transcriptional regulator
VTETTPETPTRTKAGRLVAELRDRISAGIYPPGERIPTLRDLMSTYGVAKTTVESALRTLRAEGLIDIRPGSGVYVRRREVVRRDLAEDIEAEHSRALAGDDSEGLFEAITHLDAVVDTRHEYVPATNRVAALLDVEPGAPLLLRRFHYTVDSGPYQIAHFWLPRHLADQAGLPAAERKGMGSIAHLLTAGVQVDEVRIDVEARMPTQVEVAELDMPPGTPVLDHWRILRANGQPVEAGNIAVRGDRVASSVTFKLKGTTK